MITTAKLKNGRILGIIDAYGSVKSKFIPEELQKIRNHLFKVYNINLDNKMQTDWYYLEHIREIKGE